MKLKLFALALLAVGALKSFAQVGNDQWEEKSDTVSISNSKKEKNRNEMLNAESNSSPRTINTGIPAGGDILILENDVPVIFSFYPQTPVTLWKYDSSIGAIGLMSLSEGALTFGKVGFALTTTDREAGRKFKGFFSAYTNNFGSQIYSGHLSGPMGKKGWGYDLSLHETFDHGNGVVRGYTQFNERTEIFKLGLSKKYNNGNIRLLYKHAESKNEWSAAQPVIYKGDGAYSEHPDFELGNSSYVVGDGRLGYYDANTGISRAVNLADDTFSKATADVVYLMGKHKFNNGLQLKYSSMYSHSTTPFNTQFPVSLQVIDKDMQSLTNGTSFTLHNQSKPYEGSAQMVVGSFDEPTTINTSITRLELTKSINDHSFRLGLTEQYNNNLGQKTNNGYYYQTVENQPRLLDMYMYGYKVTDDNGLLNIASGNYIKTRINKLALYFSYDLKIGKWFEGGIGGRLERQDDKETRSQYANQFINNRPLMTDTYNNNWNHVGVGNFVFKLNKNFGFISDVTYNDFYNRFYDYPDDQKDNLGNPLTGAETTVAKSTQIGVLYLGSGVYYNLGNKFSIVSKITRATKVNNITSINIYNPENANEKTFVYPLKYNIRTFGWTTDIITSPFKNFNLHFLLTLQEPKYQDYSVQAYGKTYSYDNKIIPEMSKILMEIDPSYKLGDFRLWASLRYFGKQYGNLTNAFAYNPWWENFAGIDYRFSRKVDFKLQITNFLNEKGVKGTVVGAEQITDASSYIGRTVSAFPIRPRTVELTVNFKL